MVMGGANKLLPVSIPTWPMSNDCLSWSEDDLVVAGGEIVYILTSKGSSPRTIVAGHPQWHVLNLRINHFKDSEWPEVELATIADLSIGEEQSSSHAVTVAWSPSGIGMHRRSVLGVLTSNLILSLWETDGTQSSYQRTCIINKSLADSSLKDNDRTTRRNQRIRSFAWLPALKTTASSRWGFHYIVVADDDGNIIFLHTTKKTRSSLGHWSLSRQLKIDHDDFIVNAAEDGQMSPLQKRLKRQSPITKINVTPWIKMNTTQSSYGGKPNLASSGTDLFLSTCTLTSCTSTYTAHVCISTTAAGKPLALINFKDFEECGLSLADFGINTTLIQSATPGTERHIDSITLPESYFVEAVRPLAEDFDQLFQLAGFVRTRFWGSAMSTDGDKAAACITLHPSDMIEYSIPSVEKCTVVFRNVKTATGNAHSDLKSPRVVRIQILQFFLNQMNVDREQSSSSLDRNLVSMYLRLASLTPDLPPESNSSLERIRVQQNLDDNFYDDDAAEVCDICSARIDLKSDTNEAICTSKHQFSRCHLTFLAIQEPGISKYCSKCGKEFLDLVKLGPTQVARTSLAQTMFDEFDVCPYCQGKFRG